MSFLSIDQKNAIEKIIFWFINEASSKQYISLGGYAGTGKTTLISILRKKLTMTNKNLKVGFASYTGKAARVLKQKLNEQKVIYKQDTVGTIHSLIYSPITNEKEEIVGWKQKEKIDRNLIIIDEASMVADIPDTGGSFAKFGSGELLKDLLAYDIKGKFIFIGDPCQLPPIGQAILPALSKFYIEQKYKHSVQQIELTEIIRQASANGIIAASLLLRNLQTTNPPVKFASFPLKGHSNISLHSSHASLVNSYIQKIKENGFEYSTLICQTNRHCSDLNKIIRVCQ